MPARCASLCGHACCSCVLCVKTNKIKNIGGRGHDARFVHAVQVTCAGAPPVYSGGRADIRFLECRIGGIDGKMGRASSGVVVTGESRCLLHTCVLQHTDSEEYAHVVDSVAQRKPSGIEGNDEGRVAGALQSSAGKVSAAKLRAQREKEMREKALRAKKGLPVPPPTMEEVAHVHECACVHNICMRIYSQCTDVDVRLSVCLSLHA